ncbi:unnamed protein product [Pleuronectes platessa]|uniref:Uncharacterized protein n=1 Tax=Pleuronectes platessa TaxID=8262 RepID=A0A9N7TXR2_PLEPL|nr:unnamed protein product [Pleuronectes platessa]
MAKWFKEHLGFKTTKAPPPAPPKPDYRHCHTGVPGAPGFQQASSNATFPSPAQPDILAAYKLQKELDFEDPYTPGGNISFGPGSNAVGSPDTKLSLSGALNLPTSPPVEHDNKEKLIILEDYADPFDAEQAGGTQTTTEKVTTENDGYMEPYEAQRMMAELSLLWLSRLIYGPAEGACHNFLYLKSQTSAHELLHTGARSVAVSMDIPSIPQHMRQHLITGRAIMSSGLCGMDSHLAKLRSGKSRRRGEEQEDWPFIDEMRNLSLQPDILPPPHLAMNVAQHASSDRTPQALSGCTGTTADPRVTVSKPLAVHPGWDTKPINTSLGALRPPAGEPCRSPAAQWALGHVNGQGTAGPFRTDCIPIGHSLHLRSSEEAPSQILPLNEAINSLTTMPSGDGLRIPWLDKRS